MALNQYYSYIIVLKIGNGCWIKLRYNIIRSKNNITLKDKSEQIDKNKQRKKRGIRRKRKRKK